VEIGRHDELLARPGSAYGRLHDLQLLEGARTQDGGAVLVETRPDRAQE
jgi:hypothetical protein